MRPIIEIRRVVDGKLAKYEELIDWGEGELDSLEFLWSEGNYSCDCNRHLFFQRALQEPDGDDRPCGDERYLVRITNQSGKEIYKDDDF